MNSYFGLHKLVELSPYTGFITYLSTFVILEYWIWQYARYKMDPKISFFFFFQKKKNNKIKQEK